MQNVPRARRAGPADLSASTDNPAAERQPALDLQPHGDRRRMPAARRQTIEERALRRLLIEVEGLRVELLRKSLDLRFVKSMRTAGEALTGVKVFEIEAFVCFCHF